MNEIYELIQAHLNRSINAIYPRADSWFEVNWGHYNNTAYYHIIDGKIVNVQFD